MKKTIYALTVIAVAAAVTVACSKQDALDGNNSIQESSTDTEDVQYRKYDLDQSNTTGRWHWSCKDGSGEGWSDTKSGAKADGKAGCGSAANVDIDPPFEMMMFEYAQLAGPMVINGENDNGSFLDDIDLNELGAFQGVSIQNLDGDAEGYAASQLSFDEVVYWLGDDGYGQISDARKATALLTIMGVFNGGDSPSEIQLNHNLSAQQFEQLINREFGPESELDIDDQTGAMSWIF